MASKPQPRHVLPLHRQGSEGDGLPSPHTRLDSFRPRSAQQWVIFVAVAGFLLFMLCFVALFGLALLAGVASFVEVMLTRLAGS